MSQARMPRHQLTDPQRETVADLFPTGNFKTGRRPRNRRAILNAIFWVLRTKTEAEELLQSFIRRYAKRAPGLVKWAETAIAEGFTVFALPEAHQKRMRTSNLLERLNKEIGRRPRVATMFPNQASCLRLVSTILIETSEEWETGRRYLPEDAG